MMNALRLILHISPLIPLIYGRLFLTLAFILLVALAYIKTRKLRTQLEDLRARAGDSDRDRKALSDCERTLNFWRQLTFGGHDDHAPG